MSNTNELLNIAEWHNGEKEWPPFSDDEMERRHSRMRAIIDEKNIDAALFTSQHNICYFSGWIYLRFGRKYGLVLTQERVTSVASSADGGQPWRRSSADCIAYTDWSRDNFFRAIAKLMPKAKRIGLEFDHVDLEFRDRLQAAFPDAEFIDVAREAARLRMVKSPEEVGLIREAARIAEIGGAVAFSAISAGVREHEVALEVKGAMVREIAKCFCGAELMDSWAWLQSGINTDGAHNPVTNRKLQPGDILSINCFPLIFGYSAALGRTAFCDYASNANVRLWEVNNKVHRRGLELLEPGKRCSDIAKELNEIYREHGLLHRRSFGYGHSGGIISHYYGREPELELREDVDTELEPGMVLSVKPMIMIPENEPGAGGYREHDVLVVTDTGAERLTRFPIGPEHNIIGKIERGRLQLVS